MDGQGYEQQAEDVPAPAPRDQPDSRMQKGLSHLTLFVGLAAVYFLLAKAGLQLASINPSISPVWPPVGLAVAAVMLWGPMRVLPPVFLGAFLANVGITGAAGSSLLIAASNTLEAIIIGALLRRYSGGVRTFDTPLGIARFVLFALISGTLLGATIGVSILVGTGHAAMSDASTLWTTWWLGDSAGVLVVAPVVVLWAIRRKPDKTFERKDTLIVFLSAAIVGIIAFSPLIAQSAIRAPLGFLAILPLVAAALRLNQRDTATTALILSAFAVWGTVLRAGPFAQPVVNDSFLLLVTFMISITVPSLALSAEVCERRRQARDLRSVVFGAHMGIAQCDPAGRFVQVNTKYCELVGRPEADLIRMARDELTAPQDRARDDELFAHARKTGEGFSIEKRILRPDGSTIWVWDNVTAVMGDDGHVRRIVSMCADVTDRRNAEERQTLLMAELNHRVRNTLATIQAMARLTSTSTASKEAYVESLQGRIGTMARTHERLTRERWQGVSFEDVVNEELKPYAPRGESVHVKGPAIKLGPRQALDLALALHELATNAAKYGALSMPAGRVSVTWKVDYLEGNPILTVNWRESGGPPVTAPSKKGFGSQLLRNTFSGLNKKAEIIYAPEGVRCEIVTPHDLGKYHMPE